MRNHIVGLSALLTGLLTVGSFWPAPVRAQSTARRSDFTGVWKMDTTKFDKHDAALAALTLNVSRRGDTLVIVTDVLDTNRPPVQMRSQYLPEQSLSRVEPADPSLRANPLSWEGDTLVLRRVEQRGPRTLKIEERWVLDATGQTLSRLQAVADGERVRRQTLVFTRQ
jgi:hypothetical protein